MPWLWTLLSNLANWWQLDCMMNFIFRIVFTVFPLPEDQSYNSFFCVIFFGSAFSSVFPEDKGFMVLCVNKNFHFFMLLLNTLHHKTLLSENSHDRCLPSLGYLSLVLLPSIDVKWNLTFLVSTCSTQHWIISVLKN